MGADVPPVMLLATVDGESRAVLDGELRRRCGADYEVVTSASYDQARAVLEDLRKRGRDVAMVFSCCGPRDRQGLTFLRWARSIDPAAKRAVVVIWGDFESAAPVFRAISEGHAELQLVRPELRRDEEFHESITDFLGDWHFAEGSGFEAVRTIGPHDERSSTLRDAFARNHIPVGFYLADTEAGRRILADLELDSAELPVLVLQFRSPPIALVNSTDAELADSFGLMTRPSPTRCTSRGATNTAARREVRHRVRTAHHGQRERPSNSPGESPIGVWDDPVRSESESYPENCLRFALFCRSKVREFSAHSECVYGTATRSGVVMRGLRTIGPRSLSLMHTIGGGER